jgi:hypothetical protein
MSSDVSASENPQPFRGQKLYGLTLRVNRLLPGVAECESEDADIDVRLAESPAVHNAAHPAECAIYVSEYIGDFGVPILRIYEPAGGQGFRLCYDDGTEFVVRRDGAEIRGTWPPSMTFEDTATYLVGPVMGFVLHLRRTLCLHASVIAAEDHAVVLLGAAGAGKSTTAAAFSRLGFPVISDDVAVIGEGADGHIVQPGYQRICLTPEAAESLYGAPDVLPAITPNWEKLGLDAEHPHAHFESRTLPLGAIYLLGERSAHRATPEIRPLSLQESLLELLANTYVQYFLTPEQRAAEFPATARLAARAPMRRVLRPEGAEHLAEICAAVAEDFAALLVAGRA